MNWETHILTECHIDLLLVETIAPPQNRYNKQKNCNEVFKTLDDNKRQLHKQPALGIIDNDKNKPKGFSSCVLLLEHSEILSIYKKDNCQYIIVVGSKNKAMEDFILKNAEQCNIVLSAYDLPVDFERFRAITKRLNSKTEENNKDIANLKRLFKAIKQNQNSDFHKLAEWIEVFKANPYELEMKLNN